MTGSRLMHWILCCLVAAAGVAGCATDTTSSETSGSLSLNLEVGSVDIDAVDFLITGDGMDPVGGTIDTSAPGATASVEWFGLLPGDYTVTLSATATDDETMCEGSEDFSIEADKVTPVMVYLRCKLPETLGGVRVNGEFNVCAVVKESVVKPLQTSVGNDIDLSAMGEDAEGDEITYIWSGTGGDIADPNAQDTTYTCEEVGEHSVTIRVSDDGFEYCMDSWTTVVTCVLGDVDLCDDIVCVPDGNECTVSECDLGDGICKPENVENGTECKNGDGTCIEGECVDIDRCENVDCDDDNECTDNSCNPVTGECINDPIREGEACNGGDGMCVEGDCIAVDKCEGVTCEDTGNECTVGVCNMQTGECDEMDVQDGTACNDGAGACSAGVCIDDNMCDGVNCSDGNQCTVDPTCDPADGVCKGGSNETINTACDQDGGSVCDGEGNCVECNSADQCAEDTNDCTEASCAAGACGQADLSDGTMCDFESVGDGVCMSGVCEAAPECTSPDQCDDRNECTSNDCAEGTCEFIPTDGASCDAGGGLPGECAGGACVGLCEGVNCPDLGECMNNECNTSTGDCEASAVDDGTSCQDGAGECTGGDCVVASECAGAADCVACNDGAGVCFDGACSTPGTFSNDFDLSDSVFRAYNSLLADNSVCLDPDLDGSAKCIEVDATGTPPAIDGGVAFTDNGGGNWAVQVQQDLVFQIAAAIAGATVDITTESQNTIEGTGTGDVAAGDSIVMDSLAAPNDAFNMDVTAAGGTVLCEAWNRIFQGAIVPCDSSVCTDPTVPCSACPLFAPSSGGQTCGFLTADECDPTEMSDVICDAANLGPAAGATCVRWPQDTTVQSEAGCLNQLPKPADEGYRDMPPWTFAASTTPGSAEECNQLDMQLAAGPTTVSGWYIGNPDESADQFTALAGVQQP